MEQLKKAHWNLERAHVDKERERGTRSHWENRERDWAERAQKSSKSERHRHLQSSCQPRITIQKLSHLDIFASTIQSSTDTVEIRAISLNISFSLSRSLASSFFGLSPFLFAPSLFGCFAMSCQSTSNAGYLFYVIFILLRWSHSFPRTPDYRKQRQTDSHSTHDNGFTFQLHTLSLFLSLALSLSLCRSFHGCIACQLLPRPNPDFSSTIESDFQWKSLY